MTKDTLPTCTAGDSVLRRFVNFVSKEVSVVVGVDMIDAVGHLIGFSARFPRYNFTMCCDKMLERCHAADIVSHIRCTNSYNEHTDETNNFLPGWMEVYNESVSRNSVTRLQRAFVYTSPTEKEYTYGGKITMYPGGGYVADLTEHANQASSLVQDLEANHWIDEYTKAVLVEFNVLNPNSKLFNQVILSFEYTSDGSTLWKTNVNQVQLYRYAGSAGVVALLSEIGCAIFVVVITIIEVVKIGRNRLSYFKEVWNVFQWSALIFFYIAVVLYTMRCLWTVWIVEELMNNPGNNRKSKGKYSINTDLYNA